MYGVFSTILNQNYFENTKETNPAEFSPVTIQNKLKKKEYLNYFKNKQYHQNDNIVSGNILEKLPNHKVH